MLSIIIPTYNEERNIAKLVRYLKSCSDSQNIEIIVCDAPGSTDNGMEIARNCGAKVIKCQKNSRSYQMNSGATIAAYPILYFLHADVLPPKNFFKLILQAIEAGNEFGIFSYRFDSANFMLKINAYFTRFDGIFAGGGDQSLFIQKASFESIGKFDDHLMIMEDFDIYKRLKKSAAKGKIIREPVFVSARKYLNNSWWKVNFINLRIMILYYLKAPQERLLALNDRLKKTPQSNKN